MPATERFTLYSGGAKGAEAEFGLRAENYGLDEVNFTFQGHSIARTRGVKMLSPEELMKKDVSLDYVAKLLSRRFTNAPLMRQVLQTIMYQVDAGREVFVIGAIQENGTVKGGTGWGAEFAKICNKPLYVFDQARGGWYQWQEDAFKPVGAPVITASAFTGTGTRFLEENGRKAIAELFSRSFK